jgi:lipoprotein-anchoring transpeptidase ErfK/SrfK
LRKSGKEAAMGPKQAKSWKHLGGGLVLLVLAMSARAVAQDQPAIKSSLPGTGIRRQVLVSLKDRELAVLENGKVLRAFSVGVGAAVSPSPEGRFEIVSRVVNPTYYHPGTVIPAGGDNPIGPRWIGLDQKGYGIHGTNQPRSVGRATSHGCIRLRNSDVVKLFELVRVGDTVEIQAERNEQVALIFGGVADSNSSAIALAQPGLMTPATHDQ